jgi:hypothetical protein
MFELGGGKSSTVILRRTPGASLFQSPIAALPMKSPPLSAAAPAGAATLKVIAIKTAEKRMQAPERSTIIFYNRVAFRNRVDWGEFNALECADMSALLKAATCRRTPKSSPRMCALRLGQALGGLDHRSRLQR